MPLQPEDLLPELSPWLDAPRWWLGFSGGVDSCVLLTLLAELRQKQALPPLAAVHIDHGLHPASADWARHCEELCGAADVPLDIRRATVEDAGEGPEAAARKARYGVFEALLSEGELLLLAHHLDDQVETFFLRLMRGAGTRGLAGMPATRSLGAGRLLRPLLAVPRADIEACARDRGLRWVEDASNIDPAMDRNFLRHRVLPALAERWPGYRGSVARSMEALGAAEQQLEALDLAHLAAARGEAFGEPVLDITVLAPEGEAALARYLRRWLEAEACAAPAQARLEEFARQLLGGREDSQPALECAEFSLRRYRNRVYLVPQAPPPPEGQRLSPGESLAVAGVGLLEIRATDGPGLRLPASGGWELRFRQGGERCRPAGRGGSQSLKKLLQDSGVPPWLRERLPLLYEGDALAAAADLWICEGHVAEKGAPAFELVWRRGPVPALD